MFFKKNIIFNKDSNHNKRVNLFNKATDLLKKDDYSKALDIFLELYEHDFEKRDVLIGICLSYKGLNRYEESLYCINKALKLNSGFRELNIKGELLVHLGRYGEALKVLDEAISTNDKNINVAKLIKVKALRELGLFDDALGLLNDINFTNDEQSDAKLWNIKGNDYFYLNQYANSLECYLKALDLGYEPYGSYFNIGNAYAQLNQYKDSLLYFDKALELNKCDGDLWYNRSLTLFYLERYDEAILSIDKALDLDYNSSFLYNKAGFLFKLGHFNDSLNIYKELLEESPNDISLLINMAMVLCELGCYEDSLKYSIMVLVIDSKNEDALFYKFRAFKGLKQYDDALNCIDELINLNPADGEYCKEKIELIKLLGN